MSDQPGRVTRDRRSLASFVRRRRTAAGLTQEELAERAGLSARSISDIERELRTSLYLDTVGRLASALDLAGDEEAELRDLARRPRGPRSADGARDRSLAFPGPRSGPPGGSLPTPLTRLIGRERELIVVVGALKDPGKRIVTLTGTGGIGKSRLALEVATMAGPIFRDGVFLVPLGADRDPARVGPQIARALGITRVTEPIVDSIVARLEESRCLLVLDTFEQVLSAAPILADILARCPGVKALVTSREPLHLRGEHEFPMPALALPPPGPITPDGLAWYPASVLFVERARAVRPDLAVSADDATVIAEICRRLDGLPLAIEIAAARVRHLPLRALRDHLEHRLEVLTGGQQDLPPRHRTMRDTIGWSYDLLGPDQQALFRRLSVFAGGWTLTAADSVSRSEAAMSETLTGLSALVDKSLVARAEDREEARFTMLDVVREYAGEQLDRHAEQETVRRRHAEHFTDLAEEAERHLGRAGQERWFVQLDAEHDNLRAAVRWSIETGDAELALRLTGALWQFWRSHGDFAEGRDWLRAALRVDGSMSPVVRAKALWGAAGLAYHHGDYADADRLGVELLPVALQTGLSVHVRNARTIEGVVAMTKGHFREAVEPLLEALTIARSLESGWLLGTSHLNLAGALLQAGDVEAARTNLEEAVAAYRAAGDRNFTARATEQLGFVALQLGHRSEAASLFRSALETYRELDDPWGLAEALEGFAALAAANGQPDRAARLAAAAESSREVFGARALPPDRVSIDRYLALARRSLGSRAWRRAWEEGRRMALARALELASADDA